MNDFDTVKGNNHVDYLELPAGEGNQELNTTVHKDDFIGGAKGTKKTAQPPLVTPAPEDSVLPGKLDREQLDALRLELSNLSPKEQAKRTALIQESNEQFLSVFGDFVRKRQTPEEIGQKFLSMDHEDYEAFDDEWFKPPELHRALDDKGIQRTYPDEQGGLVVGHFPEVWGTLDDTNKQNLIAAYGTEEKAQAEIQNLVDRFYILHEISHTYESKELANGNDVVPFKESGGDYYAYVTLKKALGINFSAESFRKRVEFYGQLAATYGDDVHRFFFGQEVDPIKKQEILNAFTDDVKKELFPGMHTQNNTQQ